MLSADITYHTIRRDFFAALLWEPEVSHCNAQGFNLVTYRKLDLSAELVEAFFLLKACSHLHNLQTSCLHRMFQQAMSIFMQRRYVAVCMA